MYYRILMNFSRSWETGSGSRDSTSTRWVRLKGFDKYKVGQRLKINTKWVIINKMGQINSTSTRWVNINSTSTRWVRRN